VVDQEAALLEQGGHQVRLVERRNDEIATFSAFQKATIPLSVVWNPLAGQSLTRVLDDFQPDVVHVHNLFPLMSPSVLHACRRRRVPVVVTFHNFRPLCAGGTFFRDGATCYDCAGHPGLPALRHGCYKGTAISTAPMVVANVVQRKTWQTVPSAYIFISDAERALFTQLDLPPSRCFVKWNFVPHGVARGATENLVAFTGRLSEAKGIRLLMRAWDLVESIPGIDGLRLAIAGTGELEGVVRSWAATKTSVDLLGLLSRQQCAALLSRARAAVVPSAWPEPFGLVIAEAKTAGVPPIAPAHGSFPELIGDGRDGVLFPPGDAEALAGILRNVATSPEWFDALGKNARVSAKAQFGRDSNLAQLESIYEFAIGHPARRAFDQPGVLLP
jgi:glycosyltransferase involved in cell wall biosynthesis